MSVHELTISNGLRFRITGSTNIDHYCILQSMQKENRRMRAKGSKRRLYIYSDK